jgi:uncharacterized protein
MAERTQANSNKVEVRLFPVNGIEVRAADGDGAGTVISGYAAVFDELSVVMRDWWAEFRERIDVGAFAASIANDDVRALWNHNPDFPIGRKKNDSLRLWEDDHGLGFEIKPPSTQLAADFVETIRTGYVDSMSFGFSVLDEEWDEDELGQSIRTLKKIKLYEVSPVTFPAYPQTEAQVRAALGGRGFGDKPEIPERFRRATRDVDEKQAQALLHIRRRRLELLERLQPTR